MVVARWEVNLHPEVETWYFALDQTTAETVTDVIDYLAEYGPVSADRPLTASNAVATTT